MLHVWDYNVEDLKKSARGRLLLLERLIDYGVCLKDKEKIDLQEVKKNWEKLNIEKKRRRFLQYLIWNK